MSCGISSFAAVSILTTITNSIVSGNIINVTVAADDLALINDATNSIFSGGHKLIGAIGANITSFNATGDQTVINDPGLASLANNDGAPLTRALLPGSPAAIDFNTS